MKNSALMLLVSAGLSMAGLAHADSSIDAKLDQILAELKDVKAQLQVIQVRVTE